MKPPQRRIAREWALRVLYQIEVANKSPEEALEEVLSVANLEPEHQEYVRDLVRGVSTLHATELDPLIEQFAKGWTIDRMAVIDRNILRIAVYELRHHPHTPPAVVVNEAVELAKKYSTAQSGRFVNGVLGGALRQMFPQQEEPSEGEG